MAADPKDSARHRYTLEEYFALERTGDARYEYWDGDIVGMSGLLLAQNVPHVTHYVRQGTNWIRSDYADLIVSVVLPAIGCVLTLSDAYSGIEFE